MFLSNSNKCLEFDNISLTIVFEKCYISLGDLVVTLTSCITNFGKSPKSLRQTHNSPLPIQRNLREVSQEKSKAFFDILSITSEQKCFCYLYQNSTSFSQICFSTFKNTTRINSKISTTTLTEKNGTNELDH